MLRTARKLYSDLLHKVYMSLGLFFWTENDLKRLEAKMVLYEDFDGNLCQALQTRTFHFF